MLFIFSIPFLISKNAKNILIKIQLTTISIQKFMLVVYIPLKI